MTVRSCTTPEYALFSVRGRIAQLVERFPYKEVVGGSSPSAPTGVVEITTFSLVRRGGLKEETNAFRRCWSILAQLASSFAAGFQLA